MSSTASHRKTKSAVDIGTFLASTSSRPSSTRRNTAGRNSRSHIFWKNKTRRGGENDSLTTVSDSSVGSTRRHKLKGKLKGKKFSKALRRTLSGRDDACQEKTLRASNFSETVGDSSKLAPSPALPRTMSSDIGKLDGEEVLTKLSDSEESFVVDNGAFSKYAEKKETSLLNVDTQKVFTTNDAQVGMYISAQDDVSATDSRRELDYEIGVVDASNLSSIFPKFPFDSDLLPHRSPIECSSGFDFENMFNGHRSGNSPLSVSPKTEDIMAPEPDTFSSLEPETSSISPLAQEHKTFLRAALQLLSEYEKCGLSTTGCGTSVGNQNTTKAGPLKKASLSSYGPIWKVKFVQLRKGLLTYYDDHAEGNGSIAKKTIKLSANKCTCQAVKGQFSFVPPITNGASFELLEDGNKRVFLANSKDERDSWIQAIHECMVGGSVLTGTYAHERRHKRNSIPINSPYKKDIEQFINRQAAVREAKCRADYLDSFSGLWNYSLSIPVFWIREQMNSDVAFQEEGIASISQLWKDLKRDTVSINGDVLIGDENGPERIFGSLTTKILACNKKNVHVESSVSEMQAISFARDILLASNRTRSGGDSYYCVDLFCRSDLVAVCPHSNIAEPLSIEVNFVENDDDLKVLRSGWISKKSSRSKKSSTKISFNSDWSNRFFVLSDGILSYFKKDLPIPHELKGRISLDGISLESKVVDLAIDVKLSEPKSLLHEDIRYIISLISKDSKQICHLRFDDKLEFEAWLRDLQNVAASFSVSVSRGSKRGFLKRDSENGMNGFISNVSSGELLMKKDSPNPGSNVFRRSPQRSTSMQNFISPCIKGDATKRSTNDQDSSLHVKDLPAEVGEANLNKACQRNPGKIEVRVQAPSSYKIITQDPEGDESKDTWMITQSTFAQDFVLTGGVNGGIIRGEERVKVSFHKTTVYGGLLLFSPETFDTDSDTGSVEKRNGDNKLASDSVMM